MITNDGLQTQQIDEYSINDVAKLIEVGVTTIKSWDTFFELPIKRNEKNARRFNQEMINILKDIKLLSSAGMPLNEIKSRLNKQSDPDKTVEIIEDDKPNEEKSFDLIVRPFTKQLNELTKKVDILQSDKENLISQVATLSERVKGKDQIISMLNQQLEESKNNKMEQKTWWRTILNI